MLKLSKNETKTREQVLEAVRSAHEAVEAIWSEYTDMVDRVNGAIEALNSALADAETFRQSIADQMVEYFDGKSENWQNSDKGSAYQDWTQQWQVEVEQVDEIEVQEMPDIVGLDDLEQAASELEF